MKHMILATAIAFGLACVGSVSAAQDETTTTLQNVTVTEVAPQYETYAVDLDIGYGLKGLQVLVGHTRSQYVQARRAARKSETLRMQGMALKPYVAVAIDNSSGPGVARQVQLMDPAQNTIAIVNVYCKRVIPSGGNHCRLSPLPVRIYAYGERVASRQSPTLQLAEAEQLAEADQHD